jgi:hypothetical protein
MGLRKQLSPIWESWREFVSSHEHRHARERSPQVVFIRVMTELDNIRADPRFAAALRRVGAD